jgi:hypothetical protein
MAKSPTVKLDGDAKEIPHDALRSQSSDIKKVGTIGCDKSHSPCSHGILAKNHG